MRIYGGVFLLNKRCFKIIDMLVEGESSQSIIVLAKEFGVSNRMLRYDVNNINDFLLDNEFSEQLAIDNGIIVSNWNLQEKEKVREIMSKVSTVNYIFSKDERCHIILQELLFSNKIISYTVLEEMLSVSKNTVTSDMKNARQWLSNFDITIVSEKNSGLRISGTEHNIRVLMCYLVSKNSNGNGINNYNGLNDLQYNYYTKSELKCVENLVKKMEKDLNFNFSHQDFNKFVTLLLITCKRISEGKAIGEIESDVDTETHISFEYMKSELSAELEDSFKIKISNEEIKKMVLELISSNKNKHSTTEKSNFIEVPYIASFFYKEMRNKFELDMSEEIYESIINHIKGLIFRVKLNVSTKNVMLENILEDYSEEFAVLKNAVIKLNSKYQFNISDDEIGYLVMCFLPAIAEHIDNQKEKSVVIACSMGFATGRMVASRIAKYFNVSVKGIISTHNIEEFVKNKQVDLIISTIKIEEDIGVPNICVSPMVTNDDITRLSQILSVKTITNQNILIDDIMNIIDKYPKTEVRSQLCKYFLVNEVKKNSIINYLTENNINLNIEADNWEDAIRKSAKPLLNDGTIGNQYVENMIKNVNEQGAYIVIDDGIAMPHSKPSEDVKRFGITISTLKKPVDFLNKKDIKVLFTIAFSSETQNSDVMIEIMELIEDEKLMGMLQNTDDKDSIIKYIKEKF